MSLKGAVIECCGAETGVLLYCILFYDSISDSF